MPQASQAFAVAGDTSLTLPTSYKRLTPIALPAVFVFVLACLLFFPGLADRELVSSHEARAGQNAAMILETGRWGLPRLFDEQIELQKPPLYYWLVTLAALVHGAVDAWAIRLPAALSALGCVLLVFALLWRCGRPGAGIIAACILATCWHFTWLARVGRIDMPLTLTITAALGCFYLGDNTWKWRAGGYSAIALGILLKGPIAAALAAVVVLGMALVKLAAGPVESAEAGRPVPRYASLAWGATLVIAIAGPWFLWANWQTHGQLWDVFFVYHNFERGFGSDTLAGYPWWFYAGRIWIDAFPWSLLLPVAGALAWTRRWWRDDPLCRLGIIWFLAIFALLSCMRFKRADYLLPALSGLAIFLGAVGERWWQANHRPRWAPAVFAAILVSYAACWGVGAHALADIGIHEHGDDAWPYRAAAAKIRAHAGADTPIIFFRAEVHPLAFHLRRPLGTIREWENLEIWTNEPRLVYFVMPADCAAAWPEHLNRGQLEPVFALGDLLDAKHDHNLVVLRNTHTGREPQMKHGSNTD
jgi:4-amino-4-deoxy-L-arabinose transferase-like glycosyltransferase